MICCLRNKIFHLYERLWFICFSHGLAIKTIKSRGHLLLHNFKEQTELSTKVAACLQHVINITIVLEVSNLT